jgi:hypothetical protein
LAKIEENCDHNIDPWSPWFTHTAIAKSNLAPVFSLQIMQKCLFRRYDDSGDDEMSLTSGLPDGLFANKKTKFG